MANIQSIITNGNGNVLIGTTTDSGNKLTVAGNAILNGVSVGIDSTYGNPYRVVAFGSTSDGANRIFAANDTADGMYFAAATGRGFVWRPNGGTTQRMGLDSTGLFSTLGPTLGSTAGNQAYNAIFELSNGNSSLLEIKDVRTANGSDWTSAGKRIQMRIDSTYMSYIQFNGDSNNSGISIGSGGTVDAPGNVSERMRITSAGNVGIGTTAPQTFLTINGPNTPFAGQLQIASSDFAQISFYNSAALTPNGTNRKASIFHEVAGNTFQIANQVSGAALVIQGPDSGGGNVLIGTTTDNGSKLNVNGDVFSSSNYGLSAVGDYAARYRTYAPADGNWGLLTYAADPEYHMVITGASSGDSGANRQFRIYDRPTGNTRFVVNFSNGYTGIGTTAPNRNLHVAGTTRHERVYAYANNVFQFANDIPFNTLWLHLGTQGSFTTDKIYYRVATNTSEEEGEIIVKNTCSTANIEWLRNSYNVMVTAVKARMQGGCQPCEIWIQVRYGSNYGGANTTVQWQVHSGTDGNFATVNATGTPGTGTNEANIASTDGYMVSTSNNQSVGGNLGVGTTAPNQRLSVEGGNFAFNSNNAAANYYVYLNKKTGQDGGILFNRDNGNDWQLTNGAGNGDLIFYSYGTATEAVTFKKGTSNVLIGTTTDAGYRVNLSGDINVSGAIRLAGGGATVTFISEGWGINLNGSATQPTQVRGSSFSVGYTLGSGTNYGTGNMFVSGSVGVGELNPTQLLHLTGTNAANNGVTIQNTNASGNSQLRFLNASGVEKAAITYINTGDAVYMYTATGGNLLNLVSGNVLIGTTTSAGYKLDVVGDTRITSGSLGVGVAPNATDGRIDASNDIVAYQTSDRRLKENITPIANALDKVKSLTGVEFDWKEETKHVHGYEGHDTGIIAQEVQAVMPTAVRTNDSGYLSVRYEKLIGLLVEANKELAKRVEDLESKLK